MLKGAGGFALIATLVVVSGCVSGGRQPSFATTQITPNILKPGDTALITAKVHDHFGIVTRVGGYVAEDPRIKFVLHDDGQEGDQAANDHVWSLEVEVPEYAPVDSFELVLRAYNSKGEVIRVRQSGNATSDLESHFALTIVPSDGRTGAAPKVD